MTTSRPFVQALQRALVRPFQATVGGAPASPSPYDTTLSSTTHDGRELVGTSFSATSGVGCFCADLTAFAAGRGQAGDTVACWSFLTVNLTTCSSATLHLSTTLAFVEIPGTFRVLGERNDTVATTGAWSTGNRPSYKYISPAANTATTAYVDAGGTLTDATTTLLQLDVTAIVQEIMAGAFWASGNSLKFFAWTQTGEYCQFNFGHVGVGTAARLVVNP